MTRHATLEQRSLPGFEAYHLTFGAFRVLLPSGKLSPAFLDDFLPSSILSLSGFTFQGKNGGAGRLSVSY